MLSLKRAFAAKQSSYEHLRGEGLVRDTGRFAPPNTTLGSPTYPPSNLQAERLRYLMTCDEPRDEGPLGREGFASPTAGVISGAAHDIFDTSEDPEVEKGDCLVAPSRTGTECVICVDERACSRMTQCGHIIACLPYGLQQKFSVGQRRISGALYYFCWFF